MADLKESNLKESIGAFSGVLMAEGDEGYDDARSVFNGMIDRRPALIARCTSPTDVIAVSNSRLIPARRSPSTAVAMR